MKLTYIIMLGLWPVGCLLGEQGCKKAGIYPGSNSREFIVCTARGAGGTQLIETKHICPVNTVYKNHKCVPTLITPYSGVLVKPTGDGVQEDKNYKSANDVRLTCKTYGLLCTTCRQLSICIGNQDQNGVIKYRQIDMVHCAADQVCNPGKGCTRNNTTFCPYRQFQCSDFGTYPDPYDCSVYYICEPITKGYNMTKMKCTEGSFNSATLSCGYQMSTTSCITTPVPLCQSIFQMGPVPDNLNIFYICIPNDADHTLAPSLFRCPRNLRFDIQYLTCS